MKWHFSALALFLAISVRANQGAPPPGLMVSLSVQQISCAGQSDASAVLTLQSGTDPVALSWANLNTALSGFGLLSSMDPVYTLSGLPEGTYRFILTDALGNDTTIQTYIFAPLPLTANLFVLSDYNGYAVSCADATNGSAQVAVSGGTPPYYYLWPSGESGTLADSLPAGPRTLLIRDNQNCPLEFPINLSAPPPMTVDLDVAGEKCFGENTGSIEVLDVHGGLPPFQYSFNGGPFGTDSAWANLSHGSYFLDVLDRNGCIKNEGVVLPSGLEFFFEAGPPRRIFTGDTVVLWIPAAQPLDTILVEPGGYSLPADNLVRLFPPFSTNFIITAIDHNGCSAQDALSITVHRKRWVYAPNVLMPAAEEQENRYFTLFDGGGVRSIALLQVFDRSGALVFEGRDLAPGDPASGWDGSHNGEPMHAGVYLWYAELLFTDGRVETQQGDVTLLR